MGVSSSIPDSGDQGPSCAGRALQPFVLIYERWVNYTFFEFRRQGVFHDRPGTRREKQRKEKERKQSFYATLFSLVPNPEKIDWDAFTKEFEAKKDSGAKITLEDCLPKESWNLLNVLMRMDDYTSKIVAAEDLPFTVSVAVDGNHFMAVHQLKEKVGELTAAYLVAGIRADYESLVGLAGLKDMYDWFAYAGVDLEDVVMSVKYLDADGAVLYEDAFTYADLVTNLLEAGVA